MVLFLDFFFFMQYDSQLDTENIHMYTRTCMGSSSWWALKDDFLSGNLTLEESYYLDALS